MKRVIVPLAGLALLTLSACAQMEEPSTAAVDPEHKQLMTGSRIAYKGRGGPDMVKTIGQAGMKDQMQRRVEAQPGSF